MNKRERKPRTKHRGGAQSSSGNNPDMSSVLSSGRHGGRGKVWYEERAPLEMTS